MRILTALVFIIGACGASWVSDTCFPDTPQSCEASSARRLESSLRFYLFTGEGKDPPEMLHVCGGRLPRKTRFDPGKKLVVLLPGYMFGLCQLQVIQDIVQALLKRGDSNVLALNTKSGFSSDYYRATKNLPKLAKDVARVLMNIQDQTDIPNNRVELVGHSLGAQLAGLVAQHFPVHRITGLDPAGPEFVGEPIDRRLDASDADVVDVVHCNGGNGLPNLGYLLPMGDVDIYVNGGQRQPNCGKKAMQFFKSWDFVKALGMTVSPLCAHSACLDFYLSSLTTPLNATPCHSYGAFRRGECPPSHPITLGYDLHFGQQHRERPMPRKYYVDTD